MHLETLVPDSALIAEVQEVLSVVDMEAAAPSAKIADGPLPVPVGA
jgi:hypothetical protein